jgi:hypothetical protein
MDLDFLKMREVVLANGDRVSLQDAALRHMRLRAQLALEEEEWDVVYHLREICLGREIDPEPERFLIREGWLCEDGTADPALRSVVLSCVRGEGRLLHLDSPYTEPLDRALAEFFISREQLLAQLDPADAQILFEKPQHEKGFDALREASREGPQTPADIPPPDAKSFVEELNKRLNRPDSPDSPPPPPK